MRLTGRPVAVDVEDRELLRTYPVVDFLMKYFVTDKVISEAYAEVINFRQNSNKLEVAFGDIL